MRPALLALLLLAGCGEIARLADPGATPPEIRGTWALPPGGCDAALDSRLTIGPDALGFHESRCTVLDVERAGDGWTIWAECRGEGETWALTERVALKGDRLLRRIGRKTEVEMLRCG